MKTLLAIFLLACSAFAGDYIEFRQPMQIRTRDGFALTIEPGDCFPLVDRHGPFAVFTVFGSGQIEVNGLAIRRVVDDAFARNKEAAAKERMRAQYAAARHAQEVLSYMEEGPDFDARMARFRAENAAAEMNDHLWNIENDLDWMRSRR